MVRADVERTDLGTFGRAEKLIANPRNVQCNIAPELRPWKASGLAAGSVCLRNRCVFSDSRGSPSRTRRLQPRFENSFASNKCRASDTVTVARVASDKPDGHETD